MLTFFRNENAPHPKKMLKKNHFQMQKLAKSTFFIINLKWRAFCLLYIFCFCNWCNILTFVTQYDLIQGKKPLSLSSAIYQIFDFIDFRNKQLKM
jgi:hypothetical protein